jgi:hypothetical protein
MVTLILILSLSHLYNTLVLPMIKGVLQPLDGTGLLRHYMVQVMTCLRGEEGLQTLSNALQVFSTLFPYVNICAYIEGLQTL